jgi:uncharacterized protein DUF4942
MASNELAAIPVGATLVDVHSEEFRQTATNMARVFEERTAELRAAFAAIAASSLELTATFSQRPYRFEVRYYDQGSRNRTGDELLAGMNRAAWDHIVNHLNLRSVMSIAKRKEFEEQLEKGDIPLLCPDTVMDVIHGMVGMARDFARDAVREVFDVLRPTRNMHAAKHKTNDAARVGKRVILSYAVEVDYGGGYRSGRWNDSRLSAIDGVFHLLDGRTVLQERSTPLLLALKAAKTGTGETDYFSFRAFKNGNLHLTFKRADLLDRLNQVGTGETVLPAAPAKKARKPRRKATTPTEG